MKTTQSLALLAALISAATASLIFEEVNVFVFTSICGFVCVCICCCCLNYLLFLQNSCLFLFLIFFISNIKPMLSTFRAKTFLRVKLEAGEPSSATTPVNIVFLIDTSGSMMGERLELAKVLLSFVLSSSTSPFVSFAQSAAIKAVSLLRNEIDTVSIVTFESVAKVHIQATRVTSSVIERATAAIRGLSAGGGTALFDGLSAALNEANKHKHAENNGVTRVILLSDGHATDGPTSTKAFQDLIRANSGIQITVNKPSKKTKNSTLQNRRSDCLITTTKTRWWTLRASQTARTTL
jgi:uncharacterized protein YegL